MNADPHDVTTENPTPRKKSKALIAALIAVPLAAQLLSEQPSF